MELPCIVVEDMTLEEQISTMMTENMQRSDLTVYEEAEGFQMMMDFGNSVEQVADKAGFSESTIRRRVKLLSLDRKEFKKSVKRGATLADFALLDKLDTEEAKNEVLKSVGTNNFRACLDRALREQKDRKTMNAIREVVASYATKADSKADMPENCLFYASYGSWSRIAEAPADAGEHAYWYTESGYGITVYRERTEEDKPAEKTPEQLAREAKIEECCEKCRATRRTRNRLPSAAELPQRIRIPQKGRRGRHPCRLPHDDLKPRYTGRYGRGHYRSRLWRGHIRCRA